MIFEGGRLYKSFLENSIAQWLDEYVNTYFEEFCEVYFSNEMCNRIRGNKINSIYQLKRFVEGVSL